MRRAAVLLLLVASTALAGADPSNKRSKREDLLVRSKRRWVLSTIEVTEEDPGPFPKEISQMYNDQLNKVASHIFRISGAGVTEDPLGVFSIDENNGKVYAHKPVDREYKSSFHIKFDILDKNTGEKLDKELAFDVEIKDINDNAPKFAKPVINRKIYENAEEGFLPVQLQAMDPDQPNSPNSTMSFSLVSQTPLEPKMDLEIIDDRIAHLKYSGCFDYDKTKKYTIIAKVQDHGNPPLSSTASITLDVLDSNSHLPTFKKTEYFAKVNEMEVIDEIVRVAVEDKDTPYTPGWQAKYTIISGNEDGNYKIVTDTKTNEGIISIVKGKDHEKTTTHQIQIEVENVERLFHCKYNPGTAPKPSRANVTIEIQDMNDPPTFDKDKNIVYQKEEDPPGKTVFTPKVTDVDSDIHNIRFELRNDSADWMKIDEKTGVVSTKQKMDRESPFVDNNVYTILVLAIDDGKPPATGTGTVLINLKDINDHIPTLINSSMTFCTNMDSIPVKVQDLDANPFSGPFSFAFHDSDKQLNEYWQLDPNFGEESALSMKKLLAVGNYSIPLVIEDQQNIRNTETLSIVVCECGKTNHCLKQSSSLNVGGAAIGLILGSLLLFLLLLLVIVCICGKQFQKLPITLVDGGNQSLIKYNEEGGSSECKAEPSMFLLPTTTTNQETLQCGISTYITEDIGTFKTIYNHNYEDEMSTMGVQPGAMTGNGMYNYDMWNNRWTDTHTGTYQYSSYKHQVNQHISEHLHRKLQMLSSGQGEAVGYQPHEYAYEGQGSRSQSLDQLSLGNLDDLQFLNDLGPKFKTLGVICQEAIEQKNIHF